VVDVDERLAVVQGRQRVAVEVAAVEEHHGPLGEVARRPGD